MTGWKKVGGNFDLCIGLLEYRSIATGLESTDGMLKTAAVDLLVSQPISPGKYVSLVHGEVEDVTSALERGAAIAGEDLVDRLQLPNAHPDVARAIDGASQVAEDQIEAIGMVETLSVAATIMCGDIAAKRSTVYLVRMGLGIGLGGKGFVTITGAEEDVLEATEAASAYAEEIGKRLRTVVIPRLHADLKPYL